MVWERFRWDWDWCFGPVEEPGPFPQPPSLPPPRIDLKRPIRDGIRANLIALVGSENITGVKLVELVTGTVRWRIVGSQPITSDVAVYSWVAEGRTTTYFDATVESPAIDPVSLLSVVIIIVVPLLIAYIVTVLKEPITSVANALESLGTAIETMAKAAPGAMAFGFLLLAGALFLVVAPIPKIPKKKEAV